MLSRAFFLSLIFPGAGEILCLRPIRGLLISLLYILSVCAAIMQGILADGALTQNTPFRVAAGCAAACWIGAQAGMLSRMRRAAFDRCIEPARDRHFERGVRLFLTGESVPAEREFRRALRLDPEDADACFYLAAVLEEQGKTRAAAHQHACCPLMDHDGKWQWFRLQHARYRAAAPRA